MMVGYKSSACPLRQASGSRVLDRSSMGVGVLTEILSATLAEAITATSRWILTEALAIRGKRSKEDAEIAEWFDTYKLTDARIKVPGRFGGISEQQIAEALQTNEVQASLHELLAARLTDAPELVVNQVRTIFYSTLAGLLGMPVDSGLAESLFQYYDTEVCELVGRLEGGQPELFRRIRQDAFNSRIIAVLKAIESHLATALSSTPDPEVIERFISNYRRHVVDFHGKLQPPDFDRRQRIPLAELYVSPNIIRISGPETSLGSSRERAGKLESQQVADQEFNSIPKLLAAVDRTVLLGDPGGGKSTAANVMMHELASNATGRVPFLVILRDFASISSPNRSVVNYIEQRLEALYQCAPASGLVAKLLKGGRALVVFDGLDELVDTSRRIEVTDVVEQFGIEYPLTPILVTSRTIGYDQARLDDQQYLCYRLNGFNEERVREYVLKWFSRDASTTATERARWTHSFMQESANVPDLRSNPLMLALMCILYHGEGSIPRNRPDVYQHCAEMLFRKWDARRHINVELRARYLIEPALRHLAYWLFTREAPQSVVTERELVQEAARFFLERGFDSEDEAREAAEEFIHFCKGRAWVFSDAGTTATGETLYTFTHRTFLEYFTAAYLATVNDRPEALARILLPHIAKQEWEVVGELAVQKKDQISDRGAERVILAILADKHRRSLEGRSNVLAFLARCVRFMGVSPRLIRELTDAILLHLEAGDLNDARVYLPFATLMMVSPDRRDAVSEEIMKWVEQKVESTDAAERVRALLVVSFAYDGVWAAEREREAGPEGTTDYWQAISSAAVKRYEQQIRAEARDHDAMLLLALVRGLIGLRYVLTLGHDRVSLLFRHPGIGIYGISWAPYIPWCARAILADPDKATDGQIDNLRAFGEYLTEHPDTPWCHSSADPVAFDVDVEEVSRIPTLFDPVGYLGLIAAIFMVIESTPVREPDLELIPGIGPYIAGRSGQLPLPGFDALPELPVPQPFVGIFRQWAQGNIRLCSP
jgi:hypothetical protein